MNGVLKRLLAITLALCIVLPIFPQLDTTALAATSGTVTGLSDENIGLSFEGDADDAYTRFHQKYDNYQYSMERG